MPGTPTEDVEKLVEGYANAAATERMSVALKSNKPPPSAAAILGLSREGQGQAAVLLMRRIAKVREDEKGQCYVWWNYVVCKEPYAGLMTLLHTLLRRKLPYEEAALTEMVRHTADLRDDSSFAQGEPTAMVVKAVEANFLRGSVSPTLKKELQRLEGMLTDIIEDRRIRAAIQRVLGGSC